MDTITTAQARTYTHDCTCGNELRFTEATPGMDPTVIALDLIGGFHMTCSDCGTTWHVPTLADVVKEQDW